MATTSPKNKATLSFTTADYAHLLAVTRPKSAPEAVKGRNLRAIPSQPADSESSFEGEKGREKVVGSKFPRAALHWARPVSRFVRKCEKKLGTKERSGKTKPAFEVNAFPLFATMLLSNSPSETLVRSKTSTLAEGTIARMAQAPSIEKLLLAKHGPAKVDYSKMPIKQKRISQCSLFELIRKTEEEEVRKLVRDLKSSIKQSSLARMRKAERKQTLTISTPALIVQSRSTDNIRHINYRPPRGQLRAVSSQKSTVKSQAESGTMRVFGATVASGGQRKAATGAKTPLARKKEAANDTSFNLDAKCWDIPEKTPEMSFSQIGADCEEESGQRGNWYSIGINPVVIVKISQGKNIQKSNTGLALDVDSNPLTVRSPQSPQKLISVSKLRTAAGLPKSFSQPFSSAFKGRKLVETAQPGARFRYEPRREQTPNHFLADSGKAERQKSSAVTLPSERTED